MCTRFVLLLAWPVAKGFSNKPTLEKNKWIWGLQTRNIFKQPLVKDQKSRPANSEQGAKEKKSGTSHRQQKESKRRGVGVVCEIIIHLLCIQPALLDCTKLARAPKLRSKFWDSKNHWQDILVFTARSPPAEHGSSACSCDRATTIYPLRHMHWEKVFRTQWHPDTSCCLWPTTDGDSQRSQFLC